VEPSQLLFLITLGPKLFAQDPALKYSYNLRGNIPQPSRTTGNIIVLFFLRIKKIFKIILKKPRYISLLCGFKKTAI
jgi:hypothetical protein